ncbi:class I SAM-dependent methyltransferase [Caulobacter sp. RL271]|uniref:Class I SAM-dependent methyltransferase n=1 Tax=Caulobacter segnis TaxID=88688 RepID=A0ABY4ZWR1_9CAUL|nr:class I SAM-dependent methyltransferase [Caulobacter segnis]USQ96789.1 class I SAM-dependent methyltransferase [Caulobacter segnis]
MSADWSGGYAVETGYTYHTYAELNPVRAALPLLLKGLRAPRIQTACELGFGQGCSAAVHAATQPDMDWWGCDFAPAQAVFARDLVEASGARATFTDDAFAEFAARPDLPDFDFIALHGIWSWISDAVRAEVVAFLRKKLKPGGVVYLSYNTQPGWAVAAPLRHLMKRHVDTLGAPGLGDAANLDPALSTLQRFFALDPIYSRLNPAVTERLQGIVRQDRTYLVHEYMNDHWTPMWFAEVERLLGPAKLSFATSAWMADHLEGLNVSGDMAAFLRELPDPSLRETFRDVAVQAQFRRDYWLRGARTLGAAEQGRALREVRVVLTKPLAQRPDKANGVFAETGLRSALYDAIYDVMGDYQPRTIGALEAALPAGVAFSDLTMGLVALMSQGALAPAQAADAADRATGTARALNRTLAQRAADSEDLGFLAAPATGGTISASRFQQLFWLSLQDGGEGPADWARFAADVLARQGQTLVAAGAAVAPDAALAMLEAQASAFAQTELPHWRGLGIA